jgi:large conductance mechanosensitive channel
MLTEFKEFINRGNVIDLAGSVGVAITALVNFLFVALALFFVVKAYNRMARKSPEQGPGPEADADPDDVVLLREIRDALRERPGAR